MKKNIAEVTPRPRVAVGVVLVRAGYQRGLFVERKKIPCWSLFSSGRLFVSGNEFVVVLVGVP